MKKISSPTLMRWLIGVCVVIITHAGVSMVYAISTGTTSAESLRTKYGQLQEQLSNNVYGRPIYLDSSETRDSVAGDMYALVDHPFATVSKALSVPDHWCDILILHPNTKYCRAAPTKQGTDLNVSIGKKHDQPLDQAYKVGFAYHVAAKTPTYLQLKLNADKGPISTRDYRITLEAIPVTKARTFIRLAYSYGYGFAGRFAMQAYLGTAGSGKVGFTVVEKKTTSPALSVECAASWSATRCATTSPSKPFSAPCPRRSKTGKRGV